MVSVFWYSTPCVHKIISNSANTELGTINGVLKENGTQNLVNIVVIASITFELVVDSFHQLEQILPEGVFFAAFSPTTHFSQTQLVSLQCAIPPLAITFFCRSTASDDHVIYKSSNFFQEYSTHLPGTTFVDHFIMTHKSADFSKGGGGGGVPI